MLDPTEIARYARHFSLPGVGRAGQERLKAGSVLIVGAGALGSASSLYLAAAGVGRIGLIDADVVDRSNLQRQILFGETVVGMSKLQAAAARLRDLNPHAIIETHETWLKAENAPGLIADYDVIVDGADNFPARFLCNDAGWFAGKPVVHASILRFAGQVSVFHPKSGGPCYRCLLPVPPAADAVPNCAEAGVLGALPGILGSMQAMEALKLLLGIGQPLIGRVLHYDALAARTRELTLRRDPECPLCGENPTILTLTDIEMAGACTLSGSAGEATVPHVSCEEFRAMRHAGWDGLLLDVREPSEYEAGHIKGSRLIPLGQLPDACASLKALVADGREIVVHCHAGRRSAMAVKILQSAGLTKVRHLEGGWLAWCESGGE